MGQTFAAGGSYLRRISFWSHPGATCLGCEDFYQRFFLIAGGDFDAAIDTPATLDERAIDQTVRGRYDVYFDYLAMDVGATYGFFVFTNNCGGPAPLGCGAPIEPGPPVVEGWVRDPTVEMTVGDAYARGYAVSFDEMYPDADLRFEALFTTTVVPEPSTWAMLAPGLLLLAWLLRRRRGTRSGLHPGGWRPPPHRAVRSG